MKQFGNFKRFPNDLIQEMQDYLSSNDYYLFVSTSKELFAEIKKRSIRLYIVQKRDSNQSILKDREFCAYILSKMERPNDQLTLSVHFCDSSDENLENFPVHTLNLCCRSLAGLSGWEKILSQAKSLFLYSNSTVKRFDNLEHVHNMKISGFYTLNDLSNLAHLQELLVDECPGITNVSMLSRLQKLTIRNCAYIIDISALADIPSLSLDRNRSIRILPRVFHSNYLSIHFCPLITNTASLIHVRYLCTDVIRTYQDSVYLQSVVRMELLQYKGRSIFVPPTLKRIKLLSSLIEDISNFHSLTEVYLDYCPKLVDLTVLGEVTVVTLEYMGHISDISALGRSARCQSVTISNCPLVTNFSSLNHLPYVKIKSHVFCEIAGVMILKVSHRSCAI
jgi:hypothetical protein